MSSQKALRLFAGARDVLELKHDKAAFDTRHDMLKIIRM